MYRDRLVVDTFLKTYLEKIEVLRKQIKTVKYFCEAQKSILDIHSKTHSSVTSDSKEPTFFDCLVDDLNQDDYSVMPTETDETIAWHIWHIARIEDIVGNILILNQNQLFNDEYASLMKVDVSDTGNAWSDNEIITFSKEVNIAQLLNYRRDVGAKTRETIASLKQEDMSKKATSESLDRLLTEGCLTQDSSSFALKGFWGRLTIGGMLLLPLTRHHMMHLPDSYTIKFYCKGNAYKEK